VVEWMDGGNGASGRDTGRWGGRGEAFGDEFQKCDSRNSATGERDRIGDK
jgi:hypothetical protein